MTKDEIIEMAREIAGQYSKAERFQTWTHDYMMQRLMELVAAEREACAKVAENRWLDKATCTAEQMYELQKKSIAEAIRARGEA